MTGARERVHLPVVGAHAPGRIWRHVRRLSQAAVLVAMIVAPVLGGWQRLGRSKLSAWDAPAWDLPAWLMTRLPSGEPAQTAYEVNRLVGGGAAIDFVGVPAIDPILGAVALATGAVSATFLLAFLVPVVIASAAGRVFCGWLCPFGTLSRIVRSLVRRLPIQPPPLRIPRRRPLRWLVLALAVGFGVLGVEALVIRVLPHVLLQQSAYSAWLMGGVGATFGWLLGLLVAGLVLGPTLYCATLCPTGAALGLFGRLRIVRVTLAAPRVCGEHCSLCSRACWLGLDPASGDPGPDCDLCARCFEACPKANLRVGGRRPRWGAPAASTVLLAMLLFGCGDGATQSFPAPRLVFEARTVTQDVTLSVSIVDTDGVRLDANEPGPPRGSVVSIGLSRPAGSEVETYRGPLVVDLFRANSEPIGRVELPRPNAPESTPRRRIFRANLAEVIEPGARVVIRANAWLDKPVEIAVPPSRSAGFRGAAPAFAAALLLFLGLGSLALAVEGRGDPASVAPRAGPDAPRA